MEEKWSDVVEDRSLQSDDETLKEKRELELNKEVVSMLKDSYFRITVVNLDKNLVENVKLRDVEREMEFETVKYDETMKLCANKFVHPEDREKFLQISDIDYVRNVFLGGQKEISFTYRRLIDETYKWVQSILIPISSDFRSQPVFIWYIKNIEAEKARKQELSDQLVQTNADLTVLLGNIAQYQRAVMASAYTTYNINISQDKILNYDAKSKTDETKNIEVPVVVDGSSYEKFVQPLIKYMTEDSKEEFAKICSCDKLMEYFYQGKQQIETEYRCHDKSGHILYFKHRILLAQEKITRDILGLCYIKDMTRERETDSITGIFNREGFFNQVSFYKNRRKDSKYAVVYFNLKGFKSLNYILGPVGADNILKQYAQTLLNSYLKPLVTARVEIDHFACLVEEKNLDLKRIFELTKCDFLYDKTSIAVNTLVGIYLVGDTDISPAEMYENAKIASKHIQDEYSRPYAFFKAQMQNDVLSKADILSRVDEALLNGEFQVYIQPIVDAKTGQVVSGEALIRWEYEGKQIISPAKFIPALEEEARISQLDLYVVKQIKEFQSKRTNLGKRQVPISINLSWLDFFNEEMMGWIISDIQSLKLPSNHIRFEITETSYAAVVDKRRELLQQLRASGVSILLDDFGSGYSSFSTLQDYDFDIIKLDMGFVRKIDTDKKAKVIIKSLIYMAHMMDSKVIAEGVETKSQADFLRDEGCDYIQGYYYGKPMVKEEFERLLDEEVLEDKRIEENFDYDELNCLYNTVPAAYYRCSSLEDFKFSYVSEYFLQMLGYTRQEIQTEFHDCFLELIHPEDQIVIHKAVKEFYKNDIDKEYVFRLKSKKGYIWVQNQMKKIIRQDEIYFAGIVLNVSHFKIQTDNLKKLSYQDVLTKTYNRRRFEEDVKKLSSEEYSCVACIYLDAIGLHEVNNHFGHAMGDELLCAVANQMKKVFPNGNIYRIGGDEFTVLIKDVSEAELKRQGLRLRKRLEMDGNDVSIGIEWREGIVINNIEFIEAAESKMRADKKFYYARQGIGRKMRALEHTFNRTMMEQHAAVQFTDTLIQDYIAIYCVDLNKDVVRHIYISEHKGKFVEQTLSFTEASKLYAKEYLDEENQKIYLSLLDYDKIKKQREVNVHFVRKDGIEVLLRVVMIGKESDSTESLWLYSKVEKID